MLSDAAQRVQNALRERFPHLTVQELSASTRTAADAAAAIGCDVAQIVKSLIFRTKHSGRAVLVIASGANRVDEKKLAAALGEKIGRADADFVRQATGYAIGGVPPVAHATPLITFIDRDLLQYPEIWAAAGTPHAIFRLTPDELLHLTGGNLMELAES